MTPFLWQANPGQRVPDQVSRLFHEGRRRPNFLNDFTEYCWIVYSKALHAAGPQWIGRTGDLWVPSRLSAVELKLEEHQTLWEPWTKGNIQVMDKWAPVVNDCWVLGGVHRCAEFELVSKEAPDNLWDHRNGYHVVTARELLGLRLFGYKRVVRGGQVIYTCSDNPDLAKGATLEAYDELMRQMVAAGPASITRLIQEMVPGLNEELRSFDRGRRRSVR